MKKYLSIVSKYFSTNLIAFFAGLILMLVLSKSSYNSDIKQLRQKNDSLLIVNQKLAKSNDSISKSLAKSDFVIESLNKKDYLLKEKVSQLNIKIQSLKGKYEEASNHANNFGTFDIQRYFSELK